MDKNFFNISGDKLGNIWVNNTLTFAAEADQTVIREINVGSVMPPLGPKGERIYSDALKISGVRRLKVICDVLDGRACQEDAVDINHSEDVQLVVNQFHPGYTFAATIKGSSKNIELAVGRYYGNGRETGIDLGNFSDQGNEKTTGVKLAIRPEIGSKVKVRVLTADKPQLDVPANYDVEYCKVVTKWFYPLMDLLKGLMKLFGKK